MDLQDILQKNEPTEPKSICVVRLTTSSWKDAGGVHVKKTLRFLRKKCVGYNILEEDCDNIGVPEVVAQITNLDECEDGLYYVMTCNEHRDWEMPHIIDDYDYKLVPYIEEGTV